MSSLAQPFPAPKTVADYLSIRHLMVDTLGRPLVLADCAWCGHPHFTVEPHIRDVECPDCKSTRKRCLRGSGHEAAEYHKARMAAFFALCDRLEAEGVPMVARWPETISGSDLSLFDAEWVA